jgi:hypothetical protein
LEFSQREELPGVRPSLSETWVLSFPACNVINAMINVTQTLREKQSEVCAAVNCDISSTDRGVGRHSFQRHSVLTPRVCKALARRQAILVWTGRWTAAAFLGYTMIKHELSLLAVKLYEEGHGGCQDGEYLGVMCEWLVRIEAMLHSPNREGSKRSSVTAVSGVVNWVTGSAAGSDSCDDPIQISTKESRLRRRSALTANDDDTAEVRGAWILWAVYLAVNIAE